LRSGACARSSPGAGRWLLLILRALAAVNVRPTSLLRSGGRMMNALDEIFTFYENAMRRGHAADLFAAIAHPESVCHLIATSLGCWSSVSRQGGALAVGFLPMQPRMERLSPNIQMDAAS